MAEWDCDAYKTAPPNLRATWCFVGVENDDGTLPTS